MAATSKFLNEGTWKCKGRRARGKCEGYLINLPFFSYFVHCFFLLILKFSY
uniref:Uncharacterized protein n=1 Tax=Arundo donax TaxID=35708 RepID=A0A0A9FY84_ARUDO